MISIIIPTLNEEKVIEDTIKSLKKLRGYDYEIIVADGKSRDRTIEIAKKNGVKVIVHEGPHCQTISSNRNLGASIASGDFLVFLDADMTIPDINNFFKKALNLFVNQKKLVGLTVRMKIIPEVETLPDKFFFTVINYIYLFSNNILQSGGSGGGFQMIKTPVFRKIGGYNEKIVVGEDNEIFKRLSKEGKTRIEMSLEVMHTGRREHATGWTKLILILLINWLSVTVFNRSFHKTWEGVR